MNKLFLIIISCLFALNCFSQENKQKKNYYEMTWEERFREWEKGQNPVPKKLPRATFPLNRKKLVPSVTFDSSSHSFTHSKHTKKIKHYKKNHR